MVDNDRVIEVEAESTESAIEAGLERLGVGRDAVEIEVLDDGSKGLFGLGAREARVRLTIKPQAAPPQAPVTPAVTPEVIPAEPTEPAEPAVTEPAPDVPEAKDEAEVARGVLVELLTLLGVDKAQVDVRQAEPVPGEKDPPLVLDVRGPDTDVLVGRRGKTMAALQHITRLIVGREMGGWVHLVIDVDGFKARRERSLHRLAHRMAEQALSTNRTVRLEPMPPHERRIIHLALRDYPNVTTESIGEGDRRKVTIIPR
jgi:spoIIIJ-associated protein